MNDPVCGYRFATFEVNVADGELRKNGIHLRIQDQPLRLLVMLLARPGELITREEIRNGLWSNTHVEFDTALNSTVKRLRNVLNDSADNPRYIQTVGSRGYRFIYPVQRVNQEHSGANSPADHPGVLPQPVQLPLSPVSWRLSPRIVVAGASVLTIVATAISLWFMLLRRDPPPSINSVAVLPLESLSSDPTQGYFADGLTDELITDLGQVSDVRVISRTSVMQYKGTRKSLRQITQELNVDAVVEGTILRSGDRVRITAQLIQTPADRHLWARSYDGNLGDALALQERVAEDIAENIQFHLAGKRRVRSNSAHPIDPEAYDAYLQARYFEEQRDPQALQQGIEYFKKAIVKDPKYALAYIELAHSYEELSYRDVLSPREATELAQQAARKALELRDDSAEAHTVLAMLEWTSFASKAGRTEQELTRAVQLNPSYAPAHNAYARVLTAVGRSDEAIREAKKVLELDPLGMAGRINLGDAYYYARKYTDAIEQHRNVLKIYPTASEPNQDLTLDYLLSGSYQNFLLQAELWMKGCGEVSSTSSAAELHRLKTADYQQGVRILIQQALRQRKKAYSSSVWIATLYAQNGETGQALDWLETARDERDPNLLYLAVDPAFDKAHSDPRFQALIAQIQ